MTTLFRILSVTALLGALCACESTKEQFDFSKKAPDEFAVVRRAPLAMPPSVTLPKPQPGAPRPQEPSPTDMARASVLGEDPTAATAASDNTISQGENVLLQKTGAAKASPAIRAQVDRETDAIVKEETPGIDTLRKWVGQDVEEPATVVDPVAEAERIKRNKAAGRPVTYGKSPERETD